jgi:small-conductance mechanosensitive channel
MLIAAVANLCIQAIGLLRELLVKNFDVKAENNLHARKVYTQFKIIERIAVFLIVIFAIAIALMTFDRIRQVGVSLLASAGIVGIIVGFAAQKSLGTLLAGIQIAIAQPIRIDDVVVIEGEWGRVEEITLTYVVLKIWDERRLIVPISYFIDKPFQNWTRNSTELIGAVFIYTDYTAPVEEMRSEFNNILAGTDLWDKRVSALQVTNSTDQSVEIRILASAANSANTFSLRCLIRERMIQFLQKNYPDSLPRTRMELNKLPDFKSNGLNASYVGSSKEAHG